MPGRIDLRDRHVTRLYVGGIATDYCVKATALDAIDLGFHAALLTAGIRGIELQHGDCQRAIEQMRAAGVEIR